MIVSKQLAKNY